MASINIPVKHEEQLVQDNLGLVVSLAKSFNPPNVTELDEYIQLGRIGLMKAIRVHDPKRSAVSTLAWYYIRWEIMRYLNKKHHPTLELLEEPACNHTDTLWEYIPTTLNEKEYTVVKLKSEGYTFREIGEKLGGYTRGWANRLYTSATNKIKKANDKTA